MHSQTYSIDAGGEYTASIHIELPPTPTIAQISVVEFREYSAPSALVVAFLDWTYVDQNGVTQAEGGGAGDVKLLGKNGLTSLDLGLHAEYCSAVILLNLFYWPSIME